jgi:hypothetical protein
MARDVRRPERRQAFLLPPDMQDWLPQDDIVPLVLDAVSLMDLSEGEEVRRVAAWARRRSRFRCCWPCCSMPMATGDVAPGDRAPVSA